MSSEFQDRLIHAALRKGYLDAARVRAALQMLREKRHRGRAVDLPQVLVENKFLTDGQLEEIRSSIKQEGALPALGDYEILARIGRGGMGTVYRARQRSLGRIVAVKVLASHLALNEEFVRRFLREARMAARLNHPNVVQVFDVGECRGMHYIVMEHVPGRSLDRIIAAGERLSESQAVAVGIQIGKALQLAEARGVVHCDVKPGNIIITPDGVAKLADLGLALAPKEEEVEDRAGTPHYISPEQARNDPKLDIRTDIYSLGCTLFHAVTGSVPFEGPSSVETLRMHVESPPPDASALRPDLSAAFCDTLRRMMAKRPEDRFANPTELVAAMEAIQPGGQALPGAMGRGSRGRFWPWVVAFAVGALVLLLLLAVLIMLLGRQRRSPPWRRIFDRTPEIKDSR